MKFLSATRNILRCYGWSFYCLACTARPSVVRRGERVTLHIVIKNNGFRIGTVYPIIRVAYAYEPSKVIFSSDDSPEEDKRTLRLVDIPPGGQRVCLVYWTVPLDAAPGPYHVKCEVWTPPRLYVDLHVVARSGTYLFDKTRWKPTMEVTAEVLPAGSPSGSVFVSYAAYSNAHKEWTLALRDQLVRHGIRVVLAEVELHAPMEITLFMEEEIRQASVILLICSDIYVQKADQRQGGGWL